MMLVPVLSYAIGIIAFNELVSLRSLIGSVIVLSCCVIVILANNKDASKNYD